MYDDIFPRMFDLHLTGCELAMIYSGTMAFQVQFAKQIDAVPITREYIYDGDVASDAQVKYQASR